MALLNYQMVNLITITIFVGEISIHHRKFHYHIQTTLRKST